MEKIIKFLENEYWYPGVVNDGYQFPLDKEAQYTMDFSTNNTFNQVMPVLFSSKGRYIFVDRGYVEIKKGVIKIIGRSIDYADGFKTLKGAYEAVRDKYYQLKPVCEQMREVQYQYCTWPRMP